MKKIFSLGVILLITFQMMVLGKGSETGDNQFYLYVGAYTSGAEEGIYVYKFDANDGELSHITTVKGVVNPSYLTINPKENLLVAVNETEEYEGKKTGYVSSFRIDPSNGHLTQIDQASSGGTYPCYVSINKSASLAFVANYGGGIETLTIADNGALKPTIPIYQHAGSGPVAGRQESPHAHAIVLTPNEKSVMAVDLGIDKVISYNINEKNGTLTSLNEFELTPGSGPRHLTFHPNKKLAFIISELNSTITSCSFDAKNGKLSSIMTVSTLSEGFNGENSCADIHVSPDGNFLYGSNRGHDSIVIFQIDKKSGKLSYVDHRSVNGKTPRNFMIDPTGKFLLAANQNSNNIVVFKIDSETGKLRANGVEVEVQQPVCLKMMEIK